MPDTGRLRAGDTYGGFPVYGMYTFVRAHGVTFKSVIVPIQCTGGVYPCCVLAFAKND